MTEVESAVGELFGVSCARWKDCAAVESDTNGQPVVVNETAGAWGPAMALAAPGGGGQFNGVSCPTASSCTAVGQDDHGQPVYAPYG